MNLHMLQKGPASGCFYKQEARTDILTQGITDIWEWQLICILLNHDIFSNAIKLIWCVQILSAHLHSSFIIHPQKAAEEVQDTLLFCFWQITVISQL